MTLTSVQDCQRYTDRVIRSVWWQQRSNITTVQVRDGRGRRSACASNVRGQPVIKLPLWARTPSTILHELAHHLAGLREHHTATYKAAYYALVQRFAPDLAPGLKEEWKGKAHSRIRGLAPPVRYSPRVRKCRSCGCEQRTEFGWSVLEYGFCTRRCAASFTEGLIKKAG